MGGLGSNPCLNNSERPVDALAVKNINDSLTHNLKSRDASASKKQQYLQGLTNALVKAKTFWTILKKNCKIAILGHPLRMLS